MNSRDHALSEIYSVLVRNTCQHFQQTRHWPNAGPMLAHHLRRWPSIKPALVQRLCFLGCVRPSKHKTFVQCWTNGEDVVPTLYKWYTKVLCLLGLAAAETRCIEAMLGQCWVDVADGEPTIAQHLVNVPCLLGDLVLLAAYCWPPLQAGTDPMSVKCWASVAGASQYPFCPSQYFILAYMHAGSISHDALNQS